VCALRVAANWALCVVCSRRRNPTPTDVGPSPPPSGRCWSGPSSRSVGAAADRDESRVTPPQQSNDGGDCDGDTDGVGGNGDVELLPEPTHRGYASLQKIYPQRTTQDVDRLRLFDRVVDMFVECVVGTRDQTRMTSQTFRNFVRSVCRLLLLRCVLRRCG